MKKYLDITKTELKKYPHPIVLVRDILMVLPERTRDVAVKRFGLEGDEPKTLEGIGKKYGITRERVRQIEFGAFNKIKNTKSDQGIYPIANILEMIIREEGGIISEENLLDEILEFNSDMELNKRAVRFILSLHDKFDKIKESDKWKEGWALDRQDFEKAKLIIEEFIRIFDAEKRVVPESDLKNLLVRNSDRDDFASLSDAAVISFIRMSKNIGKNPFGQWGKKEWSEITPRGVRDKAYLVMMQYKEPMHFRQLTDKINEIPFKGRQAFSQTVHNELIKDDRFTLVGRGMYALRDDVSESEKVKSDIVKVLAKSGRSMSKNEIIEEILKSQNIKRTSIGISLQDSKIFKKTKENKYTLCPSVQSQL